MDPQPKTVLHWDRRMPRATAKVQESFGSVLQNDTNGADNAEVNSNTGRTASYRCVKSVCSMRRLFLSMCIRERKVACSSQLQQSFLETHSHSLLKPSSVQHSI